MTVFQEVVTEVRKVYPKFSPACLSLSMRTYETGVQMTPRANAIAVSVQAHRKPLKRKKDNRVKSISFRCRLAPNIAQLVKDEMTKRGFSQQQLIESLLLAWLFNLEKESRPSLADDERQRGGTLTSENNTNE